MYFEKGTRSFFARNIGSVGQRASELLAFKVRGLTKMSAALALVEPLGPSSSWTEMESFSKFDDQQLCSPLTYRPHVSSIERS